MSQVIIVTNTELGWDNIVGVFDIDMLEQVQEAFPRKPYYIHVKSVDTDLDDWE